MSDTTDEKLLGNFRKLIDRCAAHPDYNPSNERLVAELLERQYTDALAAVENIDVELAPYRVDVNEREIVYAQVPKLLRRTRRNLRSSGASAEFIRDASSAVNKVVGRPKKVVVKDRPETSEAEAAKSHSMAQLSYESILGNVRAYNELLKNEPLYKPNEADLTTAHLDAVADELEAKNNDVSLSFVPVSRSRSRRDTLLYKDRNCLVNTALAVKDYVAGLGTDHALYKSIRGLRFPRQRK